MYNRWRRDEDLWQYGIWQEEELKGLGELDAGSLALFREAVLAPAPSHEVLQRVAAEGADMK